MEVITEIPDAVQKFISLYEENRKEIQANAPEFLAELKDEALHAFKKLGFPEKKDEKYKHIHLQPFFEATLTSRFSPRNLEINIDDVFKCDIPTLDTVVQIILNGFHYSPAGNHLTEQENGVIYGSLAAAVRKYPELVSRYLGKYADHKNDPLVALNTACSSDGIFLYVPKNQKPDKAIQIINLLLSDENEMVQHRNLFILEENAEAEVIICDHTLSNHLFLTNSVSEMSVAKNARFDVVRMQNEHNHAVQITNTWAEQQEDSTLRNSTITLHGGKVRNNLTVKLLGKGANCDANGLSLIDKQQYADNFTLIEHRAANCNSNQHYKSVLDEQSKGVFAGKIHVFPDAQQTQAFQSNNNILLTADAKMYTKPQLEIYADDVKCSHGATVGQLDENALFYLKTRGIPHHEARMMLMYAFTYEVISGIKQEALRERVEDLVSKRLRGELSKCDNCALNCIDDC